MICRPSGHHQLSLITLEGIDAHGTYVLAVTTTPKAWRGTKKIVGDRERVRVALGLHPEVVTDRHSEVALLCQLIPEARYIGEIGLDGSQAFRESMAIQREVFTRILAACTANGGRVMSIHSRGAASLVLDYLEHNRAAGLPILHWFTGSNRELDRAIEMGCWFSIGPAMLRSARGRDLASRMPLDRILTETDAPFGRDGENPLMPWQAYDCLTILGSLTSIKSDQLAHKVKRNLRSLPAALRNRMQEC